MLDLKAQADSERRSDPRIPFQLAASYFNGQLVEPNQEDGLQYLMQAVRLGSVEALAVFYNVCQACGRSVPEEDAEDIREIFLKPSETNLSQAQATLFDLRIAPVVEHPPIHTRVWARMFPKEYANCIGSDDRRMVNSTISLLNNPIFLHAEPVAAKLIFDFSILRTDPTRGPDKINISDSQYLKDDIVKYGCLEMPDANGFTLLQTAVVKEDLDLVKILVTDLGASVNEYGNTYGWTPLLLSCHCGYFSLSMWLIENGADVKARELQNGHSILHSLNRFTRREQCEKILAVALESGLDINCSLKCGMTPLSATFVGWDYSRGAAVRALLDNGADPTRKARMFDDYWDFTTPIGQCAKALDVELLRKMISVAQTLLPTRGVSSTDSLSNSKAQALISLGRNTRFYFMATVGEGYMDKLTSVLKLILDDDALRAFQVNDPRTYSRYFNPGLSFAVQTGRGYLVEAVLKAFPQTRVDVPPAIPLSRSFLHVAIERRGVEAVRALVKHGANLLAKGVYNQNALHVAAHYFPSILLELVQAVETLPLEARGHKGMKGILEARNDGGLTVFGLLVQEGYDNEKDIAEYLRAKYDLEYDYSVPMGEQSGQVMTFTGRTIMIAVGGGLIPVTQIRYLLELSPPPAFVCSSRGDTLLTLAINGLMNCKPRKCPLT